MSKAEDELREYRLTIRESDSPNRQLVDFSIEDETDNVAWCWGNAYNDVDFECNHAVVDFDYDSDRHQGRCEICGAWCDYHDETEVFDNLPDYVVTGKTPVIDEWYLPNRVGGVIRKYLEELQATNG